MNKIKTSRNVPLLLFFIPMVLFLVVGCSSEDSGDSENPNGNIGLTTKTVNTIRQKSAVSGGQLADGSSISIIAKGVVWSTTTNPTLSDNFTTNGSGSANYESELTGLNPLTTYYVRAYITTADGTSYGNEISFSTPEHFVFEGDVELTSQLTVDDFGSMGYSKIIGNLIIRESIPNNIDNLRSLECITVIESSPNLERGTIGVVNNTGLTSLEGLHNIVSIENYLIIFDNSSLTSLEGLEGITTVGKGADISENPLLVNMQGLTNLSSLGDNFIAVRSESLVNFEGLENLQTIGGGLIVEDLPSLENFQGLNNLTSVGDSFFIDVNAPFTFAGLDNLETVEGFLYISENESIQNFNGLASLNSVGGLWLLFNTELTSLDGLESLTHIGDVDNSGGVGESLIIQGNSKLSSLSGLSSLTTMDAGILISDNNILTSLDGLESLTSMASGTRTRSNLALSDHCGIRNILLLGSWYSASGNAYNPTQQDIIDGNCSL